jgi:hypothetical protein
LIRPASARAMKGTMEEQIAGRRIQSTNRNNLMSSQSRNPPPPLTPLPPLVTPSPSTSTVPSSNSSNGYRSHGMYEDTTVANQNNHMAHLNAPSQQAPPPPPPVTQNQHQTTQSSLPAKPPNPLTTSKKPPPTLQFGQPRNMPNLPPPPPTSTSSSSTTTNHVAAIPTPFSMQHGIDASLDDNFNDESSRCSEI